MAVGKPLHLRLFLEGQEVPVISASVSINMNGPAACSIQVVPLDQAMDLLPRTMVHLFFLDTKTVKNAEGSLATGIESSYKLLFSGEVIGFSTVLTPQSRAVVLQCLDFSSYWDSAHAMAIEYGPNGNAFTNYGSLHGGSTGTFDDIVNTQLDVIMGWLHSKPKTPGLTNISGLAGGIIRMMEAMGGVIPHHKGINDFFTVAELRCRLLNQITAEEKDDTSLRVFGGKVFDQWLRSGLQNIGQQVTFRDMMLLLMKYIYYDFVPNPAPRFTPSLKGSEKKVPSKLVKISGSASAVRVKGLVQEARQAVASAVSVGAGPNGIINTAKLVVRNLDAAQALLKTLAASSTEFAGSVATISNNVMTVRASLQGPLQGTEFPAAVAAGLQGIIDSIDNSSAKVFDGGGRVSTAFSDQRLRTQIFRPDCWYVPAPVCNVIFPEQFSQVSYDRTFLGEVTRLYISSFSTLVGSDALLNNRTVAPQDILDMKELLKNTGSTSQYRALLDHELHTGIVPRSEWLPDTSAIGSSGPNVKESASGKRLQWADRIGLFHFFKYRYGPRQAQIAGRFNPYVVCGFPGVVIRRPFIIKGGDQEILRKRQEVLGLSGGTAEDLLSFIQTNADALEGPAQFIGFFEGVTHMVGQDGGNTSISMSHTRTHLGTDDSFLRTFFTQKAGTTKKVIQTTLSYDHLKSLGTPDSQSLLKFLADLTPQGSATSGPPKSNIRKTQTVRTTATKASKNPLEDTTSQFTAVIQAVVNRPTVTGNEPPFVSTQDIPAVERANVLVPSPAGSRTIGSKGRLGKIIGVEVLENGKTVNDPKFRRLFSAVTVYEEVSIPLTSKIPVEQVIRPNWFSPSFTNQNIGTKIYQPFFGCDSIIDSITTTGADLAGSEIDLGSGGTVVTPDLPVEKVIKQLITAETAKTSKTIEKAVNLIGYLYGQVRQQALDVDDFIHQFNSRPIATLTEMLGENLAFDVSTPKAVAKAQDSTKPFTIGFHSTAVDPVLAQKGGLVGLTDNPTLGMSLINATGKTAPIEPRVDVRAAKAEKVTAYVKAFTNGFSTPDAFKG